MQLTKLSASSANVFDGCERRWWAENCQPVRPAQMSGDPAGIGTVCHETIEEIVRQGLHLKPPGFTAATHKIFNGFYEQMFDSDVRRKDGLSMIDNWLKNNNDWEEREILLTEVKLSFDVPTSIGKIPFNYIWDRCDRLHGPTTEGDIEVVDYKSWIQPRQPDDLRHSIQARCYALAAQILYPDAARIWVTLDQLRYDKVSVDFKKETNLETWRWLRRLCERIIASDGTKETLNPECMYCVVRHDCETLKSHTDIGGPLSITDPIAAANRRYEIELAIKALGVIKKDLDAVVLSHMETENIQEFSTDLVNVKVKASSRRAVDSQRVREVVGDEIMARHADIGIGDVDALLKGDELDEAQKSNLKRLIRKNFGEAKIDTSKRKVF